MPLRVCNVAPALRAIALLPRRLQPPSCCFRPPRRPRDVVRSTTLRGDMQALCATGDVRHRTTQGLARPHYRANTGPADRSSSETGIAQRRADHIAGRRRRPPSGACSMWSPSRWISGSDPAGPQSGRRTARAFPGGGFAAVASRARTRLGSSEQDHRRPRRRLATPSPSGSSARPLAAAMPESTLLACTPARSHDVAAVFDPHPHPVEVELAVGAGAGTATPRSAVTGSAQDVGVARELRSAGRANSSKLTRDDTGLPGSPNTGTRAEHRERERLGGLDRDLRPTRTCPRAPWRCARARPSRSRSRRPTPRRS